MNEFTEKFNLFDLPEELLHLIIKKCDSVSKSQFKYTSKKAKEVVNYLEGNNFFTGLRSQPVEIRQQLFSYLSRDELNNLAKVSSTTRRLVFKHNLQPNSMLLNLIINNFPEKNKDHFRKNGLSLLRNNLISFETLMKIKKSQPLLAILFSERGADVLKNRILTFQEIVALPTQVLKVFVENLSTVEKIPELKDEFLKLFSEHAGGYIKPSRVTLLTQQARRFFEQCTPSLGVYL